MPPGSRDLPDPQNQSPHPGRSLHTPPRGTIGVDGAAFFLSPRLPKSVLGPFEPAGGLLRALRTASRPSSDSNRPSTEISRDEAGFEAAPAEESNAQFSRKIPLAPGERGGRAGPAYGSERSAGV